MAPRLRFAALLAAFLLPLVGAAGTPASATEGGGESVAPDARIVVRMDNQGEARDVEVIVRAVGADGDLYRRPHHLPPRELVEVVVPAPPGEYGVGLGQGPYYAFIYDDTRGCPGAFVFEFMFGPGNASGTGGSYCLTALPPMEDLWREAERAAAGRAGSGSVRVPRPGGYDEGEFQTWWGGAVGDPADAVPLRFRWTHSSMFLDEWGRPTTGHELLFTTGDFAMAAGYGRPVIPLGDPNASVELQDMPWLLRYRTGSPHAFVHTDAWEVGAEGGETATAYVLRDLRYEKPLGPLTCLFRFALQGHELRTGDRLTMDDYCALLPTPGGYWVAGGRTTHRSFPALPLYFLYQDAEARIVARAWFAEGVPYPLDLEFFLAVTEGPNEHLQMRLTRLKGAGVPLPPEPERAQENAAVPLAPLDPLRGPALGSQRDRLPFPLDEAVDASRNAPTLTRLQTLLASGDAVLAGAAMRIRIDADGPAQSADSVTYLWNLVFTAPGQSPVYVRCERLGLAAPPLRLPALPVAQCSETEPGEVGLEALANVPVLGRRDLPSASISFDAALERWAASDEGANGRAATFAVYRPWPQPEGLVSSPVLAVGTHFSQKGSLVRFEGEEVAASYWLDLAEGRTALVRDGTQEVAGLALLPEEILPAGGRPAPDVSGAWSEDLPELAAWGLAGLVAVALAATFWSALKGSLGALFTRLLRPSLLEQATRSRIFDLVAAEPGIHASAIAERLAGGHGNVDYHLGVLVRDKLLACVDTPGFRRFFVAGRFNPGQMAAAAALRSGAAERVFGVVTRAPGIGMSQLAQQVGLSLPATSKVVRKLVEAGLVQCARRGRQVEVTPAMSAQRLPALPLAEASPTLAPA